MSILHRGILYECYSSGTTCSRGHLRAIVGDFNVVDELRSSRMVDVHTGVGKVSDTSFLRHIQLSAVSERK